MTFAGGEHYRRKIKKLLNCLFTKKYLFSWMQCIKLCSINLTHSWGDGVWNIRVKRVIRVVMQ